MMESFVKQNSGSADDAYDNFQNTMVAVFENVHKESFKLTAAFSSYVYQVNRNMWLAELKRQKRSPITIGDDEPIELEDIDTMNEVIEKECRIKRVEAAITGLGEKCQQLLNLYYFKKNSMKEIAILLNYTNDANAKVQKSKCLKQLRKRVNE